MFEVLDEACERSTAYAETWDTVRLAVMSSGRYGDPVTIKISPSFAPGYGWRNGEDSAIFRASKEGALLDLKFEKGVGSWPVIAEEFPALSDWPYIDFKRGIIMSMPGFAPWRTSVFYTTNAG